MPSHLMNQQTQRFPSRSLLLNNMGLPPLPMIEEEKDLLYYHGGLCCCVGTTMIRARWMAGTALALLLLITVRFQNDGGIRVLVEGQSSLMAANTAITAAVAASSADAAATNSMDNASPSLTDSTFPSDTSTKASSTSLSSIFAIAKSTTKQNVIQDYIRWGFSVRVQEQGRVPEELGHLRQDVGPMFGHDGSHQTVTSIPLLFHIPRSGGSTVRDILGHCYGYVQASDYGGLAPTAIQENEEKSLLRIPGLLNSQSKRIQVIQGKANTPNDDNTNQDGNDNNDHANMNYDQQHPPFVNVDMTTPAGIWRAKQQHFYPEQMADFVYTSHLHPTLSLFSNDNEQQQQPRAQARMFTLMRDPMERALSMFYYLGSTAEEQHLSSVHLEMYARSNRLEHNWMVRFLTNELVQDLTPDHLEMAKQILKEHCLVGFLDEMEESMNRFESFYFNNKMMEHDQSLPPSGPSPQKECRDRYINWGWNNRQSYPLLQEHSTAYELLYRKNEYDILLYEYAKHDLWEEQGFLVQIKQQQQQQQQQQKSPRTTVERQDKR